MTIREEIFDAWAPPGAIWSDWAKPVVFAHLRGEADPAAVAAYEVGWLPPADGTTAIVAEWPGAAGVAVGVALARVGYRPVPLYNALPGAPGERTLVDVWPIADALRDAGPLLRAVPLPPDAPPAFLLDVRRHVASAPPTPGDFDNRSLVLPADLPSANLLLHRGIGRVIVVPASDAADLAHVLLRWRDAGLSIETCDPTALKPRPLAIARPRWYRSMWYAALARIGLRPAPLGGFGGRLPMPSAG